MPAEPLPVKPYESPRPVREKRRDDAVHPQSALLADRAFWGMTLTQFLGAFNDNVYKTTLMLLFVAVPVAGGTAGETRDWQGLGMFLFSLPFLLFSGFAGFLSDRYRKRSVIVLCKVAELCIMLVGVALFVAYGTSAMNLQWLVLYCIVLFFMGAHSAFFGPGKYGILPELFAEKDIPTANGLILMTTFLAIIFGMALAGFLKEKFENALWVVGLVCAGIAILGIVSSLYVRRTPIAQPDITLSIDKLLIPSEVLSLLLHRDRPLLVAMLVSSVFWMVAAIVQSAVTSLGKLQLEVGDSLSTMMLAAMSLGIVVGSPLAGFLSRGKFHTGVLKVGAWGLTACLVLLAAPGGAHNHLLGFHGSVACLVALGIFTGMFAVPLQVFIQMRPARELKGQMIATMNLLNFAGITLAGFIYFAVTWLLGLLRLPPSVMFGVTAAMFGLVALLYRPRTENLTESCLSANSADATSR